MAEKNSIITEWYRTQMAQLAAGVVSTISPIKYIALGDGGVNADRQPIAPGIDQTELTHEVCRYEVEAATFPKPTIAQFSVVVPEGEQEGVEFSEMGLVTEDGQFAAIKTMYIKQKDDDIELRPVFNFEF